MSNTTKAGSAGVGQIEFKVHDAGRPVAGALVCLVQTSKGSASPVRWLAQSDGEGLGRIEGVVSGTYTVHCLHQISDQADAITVSPGSSQRLDFDLGLNLRADVRVLSRQGTALPTPLARQGDRLEIEFDHVNSSRMPLSIHLPSPLIQDAANPRLAYLNLANAGPQSFRYEALVPVAPWALDHLGKEEGPMAVLVGDLNLPVADAPPSDGPVQAVAGNVGVSLQRSNSAESPDLAFWQAILNSTQQMSFATYQQFMNQLFYGSGDTSNLPEFERTRFGIKTQQANRMCKQGILPFTDSDAYRVIKAATEAFVMVNCDVLQKDWPFDQSHDALYLQGRDLPVPADLAGSFRRYLVPTQDGEETIPYLAVIRAKLPDIAMKLGGEKPAERQCMAACQSALQAKQNLPCMLELIWSYWQEEGMLVQTMNAVSRRFQNMRSRDADPLANLEIDPLRPLSSILWGYVQDEQHRLSVVRRNYEYDHHYGLRLEGRAVAQMRAADSRSRFLEAFHNLLRYCASFFQQDDDTTVKADAFPVLNALKEVHLILSQGAHNQFGDLPSTARVEMLMQQWLLARPEFREFLPTRIMTAYPEPWMDRVDAMKKVQGWSDTSVLHFRNLAVFGEQLLLSIRWGNWSDAQDPLQAFNWARFFRPQVQGYSHAYRSVTGVDLTAAQADSKVDATLPSVLLQRRLSAQQRSA